jgi:uncharacterized membrane protein YphA (DoxX/SURF4 family)
MSTSRNFYNLLEKPVSITPLITFRILFGALMIISAARFMMLGWIEDHYINPVFHFKYFGFSWIESLPTFWLYTIHIVMIIAALFVMVGLLYRVAAAVLFFCFTYTELIDLTYYLNHYYFVTLIAGLMIFLPAHKYFSVDTIRNPSLRTKFVPAWTILIIKFQLAVVYTYAGLAKLTYDWLILALPMKIWLPANDKLPLIGKIFTWKWLPYAFSWLGMLYDCTIIFWLSLRQTRLWAYASVIAFHVMTGILFQIGVFPLAMVASALIFFSPAWHTKFIDWLSSILQKIFGTFHARVLHSNELPTHRSALMHGLLIAYVLIQLIFPWRYLLYPGNLFWTEEGYRFSWRVMLMEKAGTATFYVKDKRTGREGVVMNNEFLNPHQEKQMAMQPDMILQYAHFLRHHYKGKGLENPEVRAEVYVTLNARPSQLLIDPNVNLAAAKDGWEHRDWILHYEE